MAYKKPEKRIFWILEVTYLWTGWADRAVLHQDQKYSLRSANPTPERPPGWLQTRVLALSKFLKCDRTPGIICFWFTNPKKYEEDDMLNLNTTSYLTHQTIQNNPERNKEDLG